MINRINVESKQSDARALLHARTHIRTSTRLNRYKNTTLNCESSVAVDVNVQYATVDVNVHNATVDVNVHYVTVDVYVHYATVDVNVHYATVDVNVHYATGNDTIYCLLDAL